MSSIFLDDQLPRYLQRRNSTRRSVLYSKRIARQNTQAAWRDTTRRASKGFKITSNPPLKMRRAKMLFKCSECGMRWFTPRGRTECIESHIRIRAEYERFRRLEGRRLANRYAPIVRKAKPTGSSGDHRRTTLSHFADPDPGVPMFDISFSSYVKPHSWSGGGGDGGGAGASGSWDSGSSSDGSSSSSSSD